MTKRIFHIAVSLFLLLSTAGVSISKHYCHGTLISTSIFGKAKSCCDSSCGSCQNEMSFSKVTDNFVASNLTLEKAKQIQLFQSGLFFNLVQFVNIPEIYSIQSAYLKAPPLISGDSTLPEFLGVFRC